MNLAFAARARRAQPSAHIYTKTRDGRTDRTTRPARVTSCCFVMQSYEHCRGGRFAWLPGGGMVGIIFGYPRSDATVVHALLNDPWAATGTLRRPRSDDDPLDAIRGIILGTLLSLATFWMPLAFALTHH